jgi:lipoprotein-anchoring transpeptidase ErfK/SrfK
MSRGRFMIRRINMRRYLIVVLTLLFLGALGIGLVEAASDLDPGDADETPVRARYACVPSLVWRNPELCPSYGPGTTVRRIASMRLPDPLPDLPVEELSTEEDEDETLPHTYAYVSALPLNVYRHPLEAKTGLPPVRTMLSGDWWVSLDGEVEFEGEMWYQINEDEFVPAETLAIARPSQFQGIALSEQPERPFAWANRWVRPSVAPQGSSNTSVAAVNRYQLVTIFAEEKRGDQLWYLVGSEQWVEQQNLSRVDVDSPPEGVPQGAKWIEVDIFEQTIAAYEGGRMVYATLISSGRTGTATPPGLYQLWAKIRERKMSNPDVEDGHPNYYFLEDVTWTMYFHEAYAIHTAYWHDNFGFTQSHGCVNLPPRDALWFFEWANPLVPKDVDQILIGPTFPTTWVWVHFSPPF